MIDSLTNSDRQSLVEYRLEKSDQALFEAKQNFSNGWYSTAANRLYYACYYAAVALLVKNEIASATHKGVRSMIHLHFVRKGLMPSSAMTGFSSIYSARQKSDYDDFFDMTKDELEPLITQAETFIATVKSLLDSPQGSQD